MTINATETANAYLENGFAKTMKEALECVDIMINAYIESGLEVIVEV